MATVTWSTTAPSVSSWEQEVATGEYHYYVKDKGNWYSRVVFSIGRITGSRNVAIKAVVQGRKASGWVAQPCSATPSIQVDGAWSNGAAQSATINSTSWTNIGTQYAVITGLANGVSIPCRNTRGGTNVSVTNPITTPAIRVKMAGSWKEPKAIYVKVSGTWKEIKAAYAKASGAWKEPK